MGQPFTTGVLKDTFATNRNNFDVRQFIENRNIVIVNLAGYDRLSTEVKRSYGAFVVNQVVSTVRSMADPKKVNPTYLVLDEFQEFVTNDLVDALPQLRQFGLRMILAHQSFSQLKREDIDLSSLIWLAQNRIAFANSAEDADILAHEFGTLNFDPQKIKHAMFSTKQLHDGYEKILVKSTNQSKSTSWSYGSSSGGSSSSSDSSSSGSSKSSDNGRRTSSSNSSSAQSKSSSSTWSSTSSSGESESEGVGYSESYQARFRTFEEETSRTFSSYEEQQAEYGRDIRRLKVGYAFVKLLNDPNLHYCKVRFDPIRDTPRIQARVEEFKQRNFENSLFLSPGVIEQEHEKLRQEVLSPERITIPIIAAGEVTGDGPRFN